MTISREFVSSKANQTRICELDSLACKYTPESIAGLVENGDGADDYLLINFGGRVTDSNRRLLSEHGIPIRGRS